MVKVSKGNLILIFTFLSLSKLTENLTELHPKVRPTCLQPITKVYIVLRKNICIIDHLPTNRW